PILQQRRSAIRGIAEDRIERLNEAVQHPPLARVERTCGERSLELRQQASLAVELGPVIQPPVLLRQGADVVVAGGPESLRARAMHPAECMTERTPPAIADVTGLDPFAHQRLRRLGDERG